VRLTARHTCFPYTTLFRSNASLFYVDWSDIQTMSRTVNGGLPIFVNGGKARSRGLELSAHARTNGPWSFTASYAYTDAQLTSDRSEEHTSELQSRENLVCR